MQQRLAQSSLQKENMYHWRRRKIGRSRRLFAGSPVDVVTRDSVPVHFAVDRAAA